MVIVDISVEMLVHYLTGDYNIALMYYQFDYAHVCVAGGLYFLHNKNSRLQKLLL